MQVPEAPIHSPWRRGVRGLLSRRDPFKSESRSAVTAGSSSLCLLSRHGCRRLACCLSKAERLRCILIYGSHDPTRSRRQTSPACRHVVRSDAQDITPLSHSHTICLDFLSRPLFQSSQVGVRTRYAQISARRSLARAWGAPFSPAKSMDRRASSPPAQCRRPLATTNPGSRIPEPDDAPTTVLVIPVICSMFMVTMAVMPHRPSRVIPRLDGIRWFC